jgi:hypothetical protein
MRLHVKNPTGLLITSAGQNSNILGLDKLRDSESITIYSPAALTVTVSFQISIENFFNSVIKF